MGMRGVLFVAAAMVAVSDMTSGGEARVPLDFDAILDLQKSFPIWTSPD